MREEVREKYRKWLDAPLEGNAVGEREEREYSVGRMLRGMRRRSRISIAEAAEGICAPEELEMLERGTRINLFFTIAYLERMGKSGNRFDFGLINSEYRQRRQRELIARARKAGEPGQAEALLDKYVSQYCARTGEQWSEWQRLCIRLRRGELPGENDRIWKRLSRQRLYLIGEELDYLRELADLYRRRNEPEMERAVYELMYWSCKRTGVLLEEDGGEMDEERKLEIFPGLCLSYAQMERRQGRPESALEILDVAVGLLRRNFRTDLLCELEEERAAVG